MQPIEIDFLLRNQFAQPTYCFAITVTLSICEMTSVLCFFEIVLLSTQS